jgi:hypothetical protein
MQVIFLLQTEQTGALNLNLYKIEILFSEKL